MIQSEIEMRQKRFFDSRVFQNETSHMTNDLLVLECASVTAGFRLLQSLDKLATEPGFKIIDAEPIAGERFLILARGSSQSLHEFAKLQRDVVEFELIENIQASVLDAIYSLASNKLETSLIVAESESATAMLQVAQTLSNQNGVRPIEIRLRKSGTAGAYAYFTGSAEACATAAEAARAQLAHKMRRGVIEVFESPSAHVRDFFS